MSSEAAFGLLSAPVRRWAASQGWPALRPVQAQTIATVLGEHRAADVLVCAGTAAGKTESAWLPCVSDAFSSPGGGLRVLCLSPLKALITDQAQRLDSLLGAVGALLAPWHGDAPRGPRTKVLGGARSAVIITPESLEALLVNEVHDPAVVFSELRYVIVDELHAFLGTERGAQTLSLLHRLEVLLGRRVPRLGLSATLGDLSLAAAALRPADPQAVRIVHPGGAGLNLRLGLRTYLGEAAVSDITGDLWEHLPADSTNLVFAGSRRSVELYTEALADHAAALRAPVRFLAHHGSLAATVRADVERRLRAGGGLTAIATSTLELGIDLGAVHTVGQVGAPSNVAALRQRLGRSGRRGTPARLRVYLPLDDSADDDVPDEVSALDPDLLQTVAVLDLLTGGWTEPPPVGALHLSTLVQQVLTHLAQHHGASAADAYRVLCAADTPFAGVSATLFAQLLRSLGAAKVLTQGGDGRLLPGPVGERLLGSFEIFAAFAAPEEWQLVSGGRVLGRAPLLPMPVGTIVVFGGRRWQISQVDWAGKRLVLLPSRARGKPPRFSSSVAPVHHAVRGRMLEVLTASTVPAYLDEVGARRLADARAAAAAVGLPRRRVGDADGGAVLWTFAGTAATSTVLLGLASVGVVAEEAGVALTLPGVGAGEARRVLRGLLDDGVLRDPVRLAGFLPGKDTGKHSCWLSEELLCEDFAAAHLDPVEAEVTVELLLGDPGA